ncbi:MAG: hypothetical protein AAF193_02225 [Bacteroidota bacterium]
MNKVQAVEETLQGTISGGFAAVSFSGPSALARVAKNTNQATGCVCDGSNTNTNNATGCSCSDK